MCGIVGILNLNEQPIEEGLIKKMNGTIAHRGPDDEGYYIEGNLGFGHRRLSILDLSPAGHQPMCNEDKSIWITYNGEVYNFKEIRAILEAKGHIFKSHTDTEVIIHSYEEYGCECVKMFNGMFAFGLWDEKKKLLFLARDRLGIKPLYYYLDESLLVFSSEIKAIIQDETIERKLNEYALYDFITFQNILDKKTFFKGIFKLPPGHYLIYENEKTRIEQYWDIDFKKKYLSSNTRYLERYKEIFRNAVERHLISDVPVGSYLSGGFDSTSVATLASELMSDKISTFTGFFDEGIKYDERRYACEVAKKIDANYYEIAITSDDFLKNIEKIIYHLDEPSVGLIAFPQFMVSELVSRYVKVVLTGHGGDEFFTGYQVYKSAYYGELLNKNLLNIFKILPGFKLNELARILYFLCYPFFVPELQYGLYIMFSPNERKKLFTKDFLSLLDNYNPITTIKDIIKNKNLSKPDQILYLYAKTYLPTLFIQEDKVGMAHSIEARIPICDNELVSFSTSTPIEYKLYNHTLKYLTKEAMKDKLPSSLYKQPKKGFPTPISKWFRNCLKEFLYDVLTGERIKKRNIFNVDYLKKLLDSHCQGSRDTLFDYNNASRIYSLLIIELWFRIFIDKEGIEEKKASVQV